MEARKRAMQKRKKLRTLGKSRSTESEDEEDEEEGMYLVVFCLENNYTIFLNRLTCIAMCIMISINCDLCATMHA